jgi:aminopeptidase N
MKNFSQLLSVCLILISATVFSQTSKKGSEYCSHRKSQFTQEALDQVTSSNAPRHKFDVLHYSLAVDIYNSYTVPYTKNYSGNVTVTFRVDTALNTILLNAAQFSLTIDSVGLSGASFNHVNDTVYITLDRQYLPGEIAYVKVFYTHKNVTDNAYYTGGGFVFTDCEPQGARKWWPCYDQPSDKATFELTARVPLNVKLASNGRLQDSIIAGNALIYHWVSRDPVATYLVIITSKVNFNLDIVYWSNPNQPGADPTPMRFYYNNGENPQPMEQIIGPMTTYFSEIFGDHPFEKNGFATLNNQFAWGGMENQSLTSLCPGCWQESLIAHEFAHQWFGDMVTCATWSDIFLNEGFATFAEALWWENTTGYTAYKSDIDNNANNYLGGNPGWPIVNPSWAFTPPNASQLFNFAITYAKGACVLHQLRYVMGDSLFFLGLKNYATDTAEIKYKSAVIQDFQNHMEAAYGQSLNWYFFEWLMTPDHPVYQNSYNITNMGGNSWRVRFFTKQTQTSTGFFTMPLQIRVRFADGTDTIAKVWNDVNNQLFEFMFTKQPTNVYFDPQNNIVLKNSSTTVGIEDPGYLPQAFMLGQNIPNPALGTTSIAYDLPVSAEVVVCVYDVTGKLLRTINEGVKTPGSFEIQLNTTGLMTGVYFYTLQAGENKATRKMMIIK